jgi:hypothetical protein
MSPHYYLMKNKKILRLESEMSFENLPQPIREKIFDNELTKFDQNQANWRVVIFRDEIMELSEYVEWLSSPEATMADEEFEYELTAN